MSLVWKKAICTAEQGLGPVTFLADRWRCLDSWCLLMKTRRRGWLSLKKLQCSWPSKVTQHCWWRWAHYFQGLRRSFLMPEVTGLTNQDMRAELITEFKKKRNLVVQASIGQWNKSQLPDPTRSCILPVFEPSSLEIRVLTSWAFPGQFDQVPITLAFVLSDFVGPTDLSDHISHHSQLEERAVLSISVLVLLGLFFATAPLSIVRRFWHGRYSFRGMLLIDSGCLDDYSLRSFWSHFPQHYDLVYSLTVLDLTDVVKNLFIWGTNRDHKRVELKTSWTNSW